MDYLDTNVFIYWLAAHRLYGDRAMNIIKKVEGGDKAVTSCLTVVQCHWLLEEYAKGYSYHTLISILSAVKNLMIVPLSQKELIAADEASKQYDLDLEDAIHYATAVAYKCSAICSNDADFDCTDLKRKF